ncbi:MAG: molybdopterin-dependent oxidoreductase [Sulfolobales archaeon]
MESRDNSMHKRSGISRREFLQTLAVAGVAGAIVLGSRSVLESSRKDLRKISLQEAGSIREFYSICGACGAGCGIIVGVDGSGNLLYVTANPNHPQRSICGRGATGKWLWNHPLRIKKPLKRVGERGEGRFAEVEWSQALDEIASKLRDIISRYGARSVVVTRHDIRMWLPLFGYLLGTPNFDIGHESTCHDAGTVARRWVLGAGGPTSVDPDYENSRYLLFIGRTPATASMGALSRVMKSRDLGSKIVVVDPRMPEIGYANSEWIPIIPGTDAAFLLSMMHVIISEKLYDESFLKNYTNAPFLIKPDKKPLTEADLVEGGDSKKYMIYDKNSKSFKSYTEKGVDPDLEYSGEVTLKDGSRVFVKTAFILLRERASKYTPEEAEKITGVPADTIRRIAREFATARGVADDTWYMAKNGNDMEVVAAILILNALVGNIDRRGGLCFAESAKLPDVCWVQEGYVFTTLGVKFESEALKEKRVDRVLYPETVSTFDAVLDAILTEKPYPIKALFVVGTTIFQRDVNLNKVMDALKKLELVVVIDFIAQDIMDWADYVLPSRMYLEKEEISVVKWTLDAAVQMSTGHVEPPKGVDARDELWILMEILRRIYPERAALIGYTEEYSDYSRFSEFEEKMKDSLIKALAANWNISPDDIRRELESKGYMILKKKTYETRPYRTALATPSGRVEIYMLNALRYNLDPLPDYYPPPAYTLPKAPNEFYLVNGKGPLVSAQGALAYPMKYVGDRSVWMNPEDAKRLGIRDGDLIELEGLDNGYKIVARVKVTNKVRQGVLYTYSFMGQRTSSMIKAYDGKYSFLREGVNPNWLAKGFIAPIIGSAATNSSVRVRKL